MEHTYENSIYRQGILSGSGFWVTGIGHERCASHYRRSRQTCPFFGIEYVIKGHGYLKSAQQEYEIGPGTFFSYGGEERHEYWAAQREPWEKIWFTFSGNRAHAMLASSMGEVTTMQKYTNPFIQEMLQSCLQEITTPSGDTMDLVTGRLILLLTEIRRFRLEFRDDQCPRRALYERCREYVLKNFEGLKSPYDMPANLSVSPSYLCRLFREYDKESPFRFLTQLKMNKAAHLLIRSNKSIKDIAYSLAYDDPLHFSRVFRQYYHQSPKHYRNS